MQSRGLPVRGQGVSVVKDNADTMGQLLMGQIFFVADSDQALHQVKI